MAKRHSEGTSIASRIRRCQELILARSGADEFYEIIKLLLGKAIAEKEGQMHHLDFASISEILSENSVICSDFVDGELALQAPVEVIDDALSVLSGINLSTLSFSALDAAFEELTTRSAKADKGQFFTPRHVVEFCINVLRPTNSELICDPACGSGAFLKAAFDYVGGDYADQMLYGFEIDRRASKVARLMSFLGCKNMGEIIQLDSLKKIEGDLFSAGMNTIEKQLSGSDRRFFGFDLIATNPPFAGDVSGSNYLDFYRLAEGSKKRIERDVLFIERCIELLKPGGRMAIVLPDNKVSSNRFSHVREFLFKETVIRAVVSLHGYTFKPYTSQKAAIVFLNKRSKNDGRELPIHFYRSDKPGKTSSGEAILKNGKIDHDLEEISKDIIKNWKL